MKCGVPCSILVFHFIYSTLHHIVPTSYTVAKQQHVLFLLTP